jgi:hypothetical protein
MVMEEGLQGALSGEFNIAKRIDVRQKMKANSAKNCLGLKDEFHPGFKGWYVTPKGKFGSLRSASEAYGVTIQAIHQRVFGSNQKCKNGLKFYPPLEGWSFEAVVK